MSKESRIAALQFLQKIHQSKVDDLAKEMNIVRTKIADIDLEKNNLALMLRQETHIISAESAPYLADYLKAIKYQQNMLEAAKQKLLEHSAELERHLVSQFIRLKTDEAPLKSALQDRRSQMLHDEIMTNDETAHYAANYRIYDV